MGTSALRYKAKRLTKSTKSTVGDVYIIEIIRDTVWYTNDRGNPSPSFKSDWEIIEEVR